MQVMEYLKILVITQGVRQGCPLSRVLFNLYLDEVIRIWSKQLKISKYFKELIFNTLLFADDQFIISDTRQFIHYIVYQKSIIWDLSQKRRRYLFFFGGGDRSPKNKHYYK